MKNKSELSASDAVSKAVFEVSRSQGATNYIGPDFSEKDVGSRNAAKMVDPDPEYPIDRDGRVVTRWDDEYGHMSSMCDCEMRD